MNQWQQRFLGIAFALSGLAATSALPNHVFAETTLQSTPDPAKTTCSTQTTFTQCSPFEELMCRTPELASDSEAEAPAEPETEVIEKQKASPKPSPAVLGASTSPKPTVSPSPKPSPTPEVSPSPTPTAAPELAARVAGGLSADRLFDMINAHRAGKGLPAFQKDARLCEIAASRGPELHDEIYGGKGMHSGFRARNLPYWITENMISQQTEEAAMRWWLNSSVHRSAIESDMQYACGACVGNDCAMLFTSWREK